MTESQGVGGVPECAPNVMKRNWKCVIYPEDIGENWRELLDDVGVPMLISPLHDRDVKSDGSGELKKPHRHVLIALTAKQKYSVVLGWMEPLGVRILKVVKDIRRDERYWCHLDSPWKYHYDVADLICLGGYECKYLGDRYDMSALQQIHDLVEELGITNYADLSNEIIMRHQDLISTFLRYPAHFNNFCHARNYMVRNLDKSSDNTSYVKYSYTRWSKLGR